MARSWLHDEESGSEVDVECKEKAKVSKKKPKPAAAAAAAASNKTAVEKSRSPGVISEGMKKWVAEVKEVQKQHGPMTYHQALVMASSIRKEKHTDSHQKRNATFIVDAKSVPCPSEIKGKKKRMRYKA